MDKNLLKHDMEDALKAVEVLAKAFDVPPFEIYILGGAGCVLAQYLDRATRDFDIIDLEYGASLGLVMKPLEPFDLIDLQLATIPPSYKTRTKLLPQFEFLRIFVLSREDIIVSKISRYNERDKADIRELITQANINIIFELAQEIFNQDFIAKVKSAFVENLALCLEENNVPNHLQQLEKLRQRLQQ
jgi:hypothetical protein